MKTLYEISKTKKPKEWKKLADSWFSRYIRIRDSVGGMSECISCGKLVSVKSIQCGHFVSRRHLSTRYLEENCYPQCYGCNCGQNGNYAAFAARIIRDCGHGKIDDLNSLSMVNHPMAATDYCELVGIYYNKVDVLMREKGLMAWWKTTKVESELSELLRPRE